METTGTDNNINHIDSLTADGVGDREASARNGGGGGDWTEHGFLANLAGASWQPVETPGEGGNCGN